MARGKKRGAHVIACLGRVANQLDANQSAANDRPQTFPLRFPGSPCSGLRLISATVPSDATTAAGFATVSAAISYRRVTSSLVPSPLSRLILLPVLVPPTDPLPILFPLAFPQPLLFRFPQDAVASHAAISIDPNVLPRACVVRRCL